MSLFEDLFDNQQRPRHINYQEHAFGRQKNLHHNHRARYKEHDLHYSQSRDWDDRHHLGPIVRKLGNNKMLLVLVGLVLFFVLALFVAALAFVLPMLPKLLGYVDSNGLKSLLDQGISVLSKVLAFGGK